MHTLEDNNLPRPSHLQEEYWEAIDDAFQRAKRAQQAGDDRLLIGSMKELVEAVARVAKSALNEPVPSNKNFTATVGSAHQALVSQPGLDLAPGSITGQAAQASKTLAASLATIRNHMGTGHGRPVLSPVPDEAVEMAVFGGLLWTRWALRRLDLALMGALEPLLSDLFDGIFYSGDLSRRLEAANIPDLEKSKQRRLGVAVGQRAARDTVNVTLDGVMVPAHSDDVMTWPVDYRVGVLEGLFIDFEGLLRVGTPPLALRFGAGLVRALSEEEQRSTLMDLYLKIIESMSSAHFLRYRMEVKDLLFSTKDQLGQKPSEVWVDIARHVLHREA